MPTFEFKKTRLVYWENAANSLTTDANTLKNNVKRFNAIGTSGVSIGQLAASAHNWHSLAFDHLGLYMKPNEFMYLMHTSKSIKFKNVKMSISHTIPTAKYAQTNTTQLSFNNTIYSFIYELHDKDNCRAAGQNTVTIDFLMSYDGGLASNLARVNLPKNPINFVYPWSTNYIETQYSRVNKGTQIAAALPDNLNSDIPLTELQVMYDSIPEFFHDIDNMYCLYPGENEYVFEFEIPSTPYSYINCDAIDYNELRGAMEKRSRYFFNTSKTPTSSNFNDWNWINQWLIGAVMRQNAGLVSDFVSANKKQLIEGLHYNSELFYGAPDIFIKGNPILDADSSLVTHTFQGMVTWSLQVEAEPLDISIPRPLTSFWGQVEATQVFTAGDTNYTTAVEERLHKRFPMRLTTGLSRGFGKSQHLVHDSGNTDLVPNLSWNNDMSVIAQDSNISTGFAANSAVNPMVSLAATTAKDRRVTRSMTRNP